MMRSCCRLSDVGIEIWHYTGATMFSLLTDAPDIFGVFANNGRVYLRRSLDSRITAITI